jgi:hypothetical protein
MAEQQTTSQKFEQAMVALATAGGLDLTKAKPQREGGATQLFHQPDKRPDGWAGSQEEAENEFEETVTAAGTDYLKKSLQAVQADIGAKLEKSGATAAEILILKGEDPTAKIKEKLVKAADKGDLPRLTKAEHWAFNFAKAGGKFEPVKEKEEKDEEKAKEAIKKAGAFAAFVQQQAATNRQAVDVSPFLTELVKAQTLGFQTILEENALLKAKISELVEHGNALGKIITKEQEDAKAFRKAMAEAVVQVASQQAATQELLAGAAAAPAGGPRSQMRELQILQGGAIHGAPAGLLGAGTTVLQKGAGDADDLRGELYNGSLRKAASAVLCDMVTDRKLHPDVVSRFEAGSPLEPQIEAAVLQALQTRAVAR